MQNMINFANNQTVINAIETMFTIDTSVEAINNNESEITMTSINTNDFIIDTTSDADYSITITFEEGECEVTELNGQYSLVTFINNRCWSLTEMINVDVSFAGRVNSKFQGVNGWLIVSGEQSDFVIAPQGRLAEYDARKWSFNAKNSSFISTVVTIK
jgi:hypothetical protein